MGPNYILKYEQPESKEFFFVVNYNANKVIDNNPSLDELIKLASERGYSQLSIKVPPSILENVKRKYYPPDYISSLI
ncbi:MAG: hypothetical protein ABIA37_01060 [Candidatus Woesearchaeota archaeon]